MVSFSIKYLYTDYRITDFSKKKKKIPFFLKQCYLGSSSLNLLPRNNSDLERCGSFQHTVLYRPKHTSARSISWVFFHSQPVFQVFPLETVTLALSWILQPQATDCTTISVKPWITWFRTPRKTFMNQISQMTYFVNKLQNNLIKSELQQDEVKDHF